MEELSTWESGLPSMIPTPVSANSSLSGPGNLKDPSPSFGFEIFTFEVSKIQSFLRYRVVEVFISRTISGYFAKLIRVQRTYVSGRMVNCTENSLYFLITELGLGSFWFSGPCTGLKGKDSIRYVKYFTKTRFLLF